MLTALDFIHLPYTPDLTLAGIGYACRAFPIPDDFLGKFFLGRIHRLIARKAAELSFRRLLSAQEVPFENVPGAPFTDPHQYDVTLGNRRCILRSLLISAPGQIQHLNQAPEMLLSAAAILPNEHLFSQNYHDLDIYIFAFVQALAPSISEALHHATTVKSPVYLFHPMPAAWSLPTIWAPLGALVLRNEAETGLVVELGGLDHQRRFITEQISLNANSSQNARLGFHALFYLHAVVHPAGKLGISSQRLGRVHWAQSGGWENLWLAGEQITLAGWISRGHFRQQAARQYRGKTSFLHPRTTTPHRWLPVSQLRPMSELLETTRSWASHSKQSDDSPNFPI